MENFDWTSFTKKIAVRAKLSDLYNAWTKANELEKWFLEKVSFFDANKELISKDKNATQDTAYEWLWYLYQDPMIGKITSANGKDELQFTFEGECLVDIKLSEENGNTIVELRHHNIPTDDYSKQYIRLGCSNGWHFYLTNLKSIYEGGLDLRNKDSNLNPMINN
ncbi:SRPBCC family protein [Flavobacterium branchiicola]|uniref:SRPBCC domain-containing protein n=1 Tax=Flavobacterium branchiicola TaxID=1114875 RepID=A0ABV9PKJ4_9FLAO|nr:SRPBCC domain-containing protein [Flavobacterium branchiicola]MBS7255983.1 SRPBCC domain-containing protein [Flavobacterium branchiicola]